MATSEENPFAPPQTDEPLLAYETPRPVGEGGSRRLVTGWYVVWLLNMPVCAFFGWMGTSVAGRIGMLVGIATLLAVGGMAAHRQRFFGMVLAWGGLLLALTQFYPVIQVTCGLITGVIMQAIGFAGDGGRGPDGFGNQGFAGGLLATLICGGMLAAGCLGVGLVLSLVTPRRWWVRLEPVE